MRLDKSSSYILQNCFGVSLNDKWISSTLADVYASLSPQVSWYIHVNGETWKQKADEELLPNFEAILKQDHFK